MIFAVTLSACRNNVVLLDAHRMLTIIMSIIFNAPKSEHKVTHYLFGCGVAVAVFVLLLGCVLFFNRTSQWDLAAASWIQQQRSPVVDQWILGITMLGDGLLGSFIALCAAGCLLIARRWWMSCYLVCVALSGYLSVYVAKVIIGRDRPVAVDALQSSYSFPSGHSSTAVLWMGSFALIMSMGTTVRLRYSLYTLAAFVASLVAFSRVYLYVHWPTDVIAGMALGFTLLMPLAWQLHTADAIQEHWFKPALLGLSLVVGAVYLLVLFSHRAVAYGVA